MQELINALEKVNNGELPVEQNVYNSKYIKCPEVVSLACDYLITKYGQVNYENVRILRDKGFEVYPGEKDSFGWLIGCIKTKKGIITFG